jgi:hypothetical protein
MPRRSVGSVTQKRSLWYAVLNIKKSDASSRSRFWSTGFKTRREAERALAQLLIEERQAKASQATVVEVVSRYITEDVTVNGRSKAYTFRCWVVACRIRRFITCIT